ncbi:MAG: hypothetical protein K2R93_07085 [Gemmatimonadaceae bacterium]|nr:hypothetical protein [Gemmatimonadaceae bacterium]
MPFAAGGTRRRVLIGTCEIAHHVVDLVEGFRRLGHDATSVMYHRNKYYPDATYDIDATGTSLSTESLLSLINSHDLFIFIWTSLLPDNNDFPVLRTLGKEIVTIFCGDDVRHWSAYSQDYGRDLRDRVPVLDTIPLEKQLRTLRRAEMVADAVFSRPNQHNLGVRPYHHFHLPIDLRRITAHIPDREIPVVVHAPSNQGGKGSDLVLTALDTLKAEGVAFELRLLTDVSNGEVLAALADADVAIDQVFIPGISRFGQEALASGCALASVIESPYAESPDVPPVWHIGEHTLVEPFRELLSNRALRRSLAERARTYVEQHYDVAVVAKGILDVLDQRTRGPFDHYPRFYLTDYRLPPQHTIPPDVADATSQVVRRWGVPHDADVRRLIREGFLRDIPFGGFDTLPRWAPGTGARRPSEAPWPRNLEASHNAAAPAAVGVSDS